MPRFDPIPGETPIDDLSGLIPTGIQTRAELATVEAENIRKAVVRYLGRRPSTRTAPFTSDWVLRLHKEMFGAVWTWAGEIRRTQKNLGVSAREIRVELKKLLDDLAYWRNDSSMDPAEQSARLHHRAVVIHPFENGNGRWARLVTNIYTKQTTGLVTAWPEATIGATSVLRDRYLEILRAADAGDLAPLVALHREMTK